MQTVRKNNGIQILRGILFFGITAFHFGLPGSQILWGGVETFFTLSSFFLTKKLLKIQPAQISIGREMIHRVARLYPVYFFVLLSSLCIVWQENHVIAAREFAAHSLFLQNFDWMITGYGSAFQSFTAHTWTLGIEIWLFLIWVIAFHFIKNFKGRAVFNGSMIFLAVGYRIITTILVRDAMIISLFPLAHADAFSIGSLMALKEEYRRERNYTEKIWILMGSVLLVISIAVTAKVHGVPLHAGYDLYKSSENYLNHWYTSNVYLYLSILSAGVISFFHRVRIPDWKCMNVLVLCGDYSYGAYMLHWPIRVLLLRSMNSSFVTAAAVGAVSIGISCLLEKIFMRQEKKKFIE